MHNSTSNSAHAVSKVTTMLSQKHIDMLAVIAAKDIQLIVRVFKNAYMNGDMQMTAYIYDNYFDKISDEQKTQLYEFCIDRMPAELLADYTIFVAMQR